MFKINQETSEDLESFQRRIEENQEVFFKSLIANIANKQKVLSLGAVVVPLLKLLKYKRRTSCTNEFYKLYPQCLPQ